jgi:CIC family chloride channel protein
VSSASETLASSRARLLGWLRGSVFGLFFLALLVGVGSGFGAIGFRYLIYGATWLATGHTQFGQFGHVGSDHFRWLGLGFFVVIPIVGGLIYGPLIYRYAREARGHGVPEVMMAVAENGGRIRPQVSAVKALASAICIGVGGSVGREGPIVQIGSSLASSLGQWVRMPEHRLRVLVACGAGGGIAATFNAPITGVFFGVEIILRAFSIEAIFTVMLSAMVADLISQVILGSGKFFSGFPSGLALHHAQNYLLIVVLAVIAGLLGIGFKNVLYWIEDLCDRLWEPRPEWARPAVGGVALGLLLLALPELYGVGYPVMDMALHGHYVLWFLVLLAVTKMIATSLTIGIGGSGGVFAPSLFIGAMSGMAFGVTADHLFGARAGEPALYAVVAMGAVFAAAARAPLTSLASVVEMTGDFTLTLPVMLAVAVASSVSRVLSYGTIYTTKLLRRGIDIDQPTPMNGLESLTVADVMDEFPNPLPTNPPLDGSTSDSWISQVGLMTHSVQPQAVFANESLDQALRQLVAFGRDGLPVLSTDGVEVRGWITSQHVLEGLARRIEAAQSPLRAAAAVAQNIDADGPPGERVGPSLGAYHVTEVALIEESPATGRRLGDLEWPPGARPVSLLRDRRLCPPTAQTILRPGDRISVLVASPKDPDPSRTH